MNNTHNLTIGYVLWIFGFMGGHRFYFGRPISGTLYFFTLGFFLIGWFIDLFLMPSMEREADRHYVAGNCNYSVAWVLLTFLGVFGLHRFYMGKWVSGLVYLLTGGLFLVGIIYDYWTLNQQINDQNAELSL